MDFIIREISGNSKFLYDLYVSKNIDLISIIINNTYKFNYYSNLISTTFVLYFYDASL